MLITRKSTLRHTKPDIKNYAYAASAKVFVTEDLFIYSEQVSPGDRASAPHFHRDMDEVAIITKGTLVAFEGSEQVELSEGDSICFEKNSEKLHFLENQSQELAEFLVIRKNLQKDDAVYQVPKS